MYTSGSLARWNPLAHRIRRYLWPGSLAMVAPIRLREPTLRKPPRMADQVTDHIQQTLARARAPPGRAPNSERMRGISRSCTRRPFSAARGPIMHEMWAGSPQKPTKVGELRPPFLPRWA